MAGKGHGSKLVRKKAEAIAALLSQPNVEEAARVAGITAQVLQTRAGLSERGELHPGMPHWITLSEQDEQRLREWVRKSRRIQPVS